MFEQQGRAGARTARGCRSGEDAQVLAVPCVQGLCIIRGALKRGWQECSACGAGVFTCTPSQVQLRRIRKAQIPVKGLATAVDEARDCAHGLWCHGALRRRIEGRKGVVPNNSMPGQAERAIQI